MKLLLLLSGKSIWNRRFTTILMALSVALSVLLILGIERIRIGARNSFQNTISDTDLIVGARGGTIQLLLYSVFRIGNPSNNISWGSYKKFASHPDVMEAVPISLGDSHRGFRVIGTTARYFSYYRFTGGRPLHFKIGGPFRKQFDAVIGSKVAKELGYNVGNTIVLSHGTGQIVFEEHSDHPFSVVGILTPTGTPVDNSVHVPLEGLQAIHEDLADEKDHEKKEQSDHIQVSAAFLRLKSKFGILQLQRQINEYPEEALTAILPGMTLGELWKTIGIIENALFAVSFLAFVISLIGMTLVFLSGLSERRREMAILRSLGARPEFVFGLLVFEAVLLAILGVISGFLILSGILLIAQPIIQENLGLEIGLLKPNAFEVIFIMLVFAGTVTAAVIPAIKAYRNTLADGLTIHS